MELERTTALYFSPAGGTKKVTERIAQSLGARAESADVTVRARELEFGPAELVVIGVPVYGGRVPWPVGERLSRLKLAAAKLSLKKACAQRREPELFI